MMKSTDGKYMRTEGQPVTTNKRNPTMTTATKMRFSEPEMDAAFKRVQNPDDWRGPINCVVLIANKTEIENTRQKKLIIEAIEFYTATEAEITPLDGRLYRVTAAGYRAGPAGP